MILMVMVWVDYSLNNGGAALLVRVIKNVSLFFHLLNLEP